MAYRFLLEVPENLADDASAAVSAVDDAQVLVIRNSHGLGFDDPYVDLTIAAHSLRVIDQLYDWFDELGVTRPESRITIGLVLHGGQRIALHEMDRASVIAAIRRDQPWVEHTIPKIGEHEGDIVRSDFVPPLAGTDAAERSAAVATAPATATAAEVLAVNMVDTEDELTVGGIAYAVIPVLDMAAAERFYADLFAMTLVQRVRRDAVGGWTALPSGYDHALASRDDTEADIAFLLNGALGIALQSAGRAARLDYSRISNTIGITVDARTASRIKAIVLMRGYSLLAVVGPVFEFRDPFGVAWHIHPAS